MGIILVVNDYLHFILLVVLVFLLVVIIIMISIFFCLLLICIIHPLLLGEHKSFFGPVAKNCDKLKLPRPGEGCIYLLAPPSPAPKLCQSSSRAKRMSTLYSNTNTKYTRNHQIHQEVGNRFKIRHFQVPTTDSSALRLPCKSSQNQ